MSDLRVQAAEAIRKLSFSQQHLHNVVWRRVQDHVAAGAPKGAKVYEVHHRIEKARETYFSAVIEGKCPSNCEAAVRTAHPLFFPEKITRASENFGG